MLELIRRGVAIYFVGPLFYMYRHLKVRLKIQGSIFPVDISVYIGIKQAQLRHRWCIIMLHYQLRIVNRFRVL